MEGKNGECGAIEQLAALMLHKISSRVAIVPPCSMAGPKWSDNG